MKLNIDEAKKIVKRGGIIIFPTDTAYGIGCRIDMESSVKRLFEIRERPLNKAVPVLFHSISQVEQFVLPFERNVKALMKKHWPGALTIVLKCREDKVTGLVRGGGDTLGTRIPNNSLILGLIKEVGIPIIGTSANFAGKPAPFTFSEVDKDLLKKTDGILIQKTQHENHRLVSTVIDCTSSPWKILRKGAVGIDLLTILSIDTSDKDRVEIALKTGGKRRILKAKREKSSQAVIPIINKIVNENGLTLRDLDAIEVNVGPGSYTGIRVGISIANALSSVLKIPINSKKVGELVEAKYK